MKTNTKLISIKGLEMAVPTKRLIQVQVIIDNTLGYVDNLEILFNKHGQQEGKELRQKLEYNKELSKDGYSCFTTVIQFLSTGYRTYIFAIVLNGMQYFIKSDGKNGSILTNEDYPFFETFAYENEFSTPKWVKGGIMYQVYVDTFNTVNIPDTVLSKVSPWGADVKWLPDKDGEYRNDKFFGGNLQGIIEKLPYLQSLGVTIIYLTPIFASNSSNRYDIIDYEKIDEMVGDWTILEELYNQAHALGMHLVFDCVFNHCNPENELYSNQKELFTGHFWWGYKHLAEFDMNSEEYRKLLKKLLNKYLHFCDGIRLDVADNLSDDILRLIRCEVKQIEKKLQKQIYVLGEVWKNAVNGEYRKFLEGDELDSVMNYQFADAIFRYVRWGDAITFERKIFHNVLKLYPKCVIDVLMNPLSTHDIPRIPNMFKNALMLKETYLEGQGDVFIWDYDKLPLWNKDGIYQTEVKRLWEYHNSGLKDEEKEHVQKLQKLAVVMQYTLPGIPSIFAGDELGVAGLKDPFNRTCMPWEIADDSEIRRFYTKLAHVRKKYREIFAEGECSLEFIDNDLCIYKREGNGKSVYCIINRTNKMHQIPIECGTTVIFSTSGNNSTNQISPYEALIIM